MTDWRFRAHMRFTPGSGMAQWCYDQNVVRLGQAHHLNEEALNAELSGHSVDGDTYEANFFFNDEELAVDTYNTIVEVTSWLEPDARSFLDVHSCNHEVGGPCPQPEMRWAQ